MTKENMRLNKSEASQSEVSQKKNAEFFLEEHAEYRKNVESIDTYSSISAEINNKISGIARLLDIGNGGVFDYDASLAKQIVGLDLFLNDLPCHIHPPVNVTMVQGSALSIPGGLSGFDGVIMVMLLHHLVGKSAAECASNVQNAIHEAFRVLGPEGKIIIVESCVPFWFFAFEKIVFRPAAWLIERLIKHPPTLQYTKPHLVKMMKSAGFRDVDVLPIQKGQFVMQFGVKVPSFLTPVQPVLFAGYK